MRYDVPVFLLTSTPSNDDDLDHDVNYQTKNVMANVKRTNLSLANGQMYDATIVRTFGNQEADAIGFSGEYVKNDPSTIHLVQKVGRHFNRTDFYIIHSEVIYHG